MNKYIIPAVIALVVSGLVGVFFTGVANQSNQSLDLAGLSSADTQVTSLKVSGPSVASGIASKLTLIKKGTVNCSGALSGSTVVSSSTMSVDCNITGVRSSDTVFVGRPAAMTSKWFYVGGYASTTVNDYIVATIYNAGPTAVPPSTATTSVPYLIFR